jgi:hypothetical protein
MANSKLANKWKSQLQISQQMKKPTPNKPTNEKANSKLANKWKSQLQINQQMKKPTLK